MFRLCICNDQFLECISCIGLKIRFYNALVLDVDDHSIQFRIEIESVRELSEKKDKLSKVVRIRNVELDGLLLNGKEMTRRNAHNNRLYKSRASEYNLIDISLFYSITVG